jgi:hypothetical protein
MKSTVNTETGEIQYYQPTFTTPYTHTKQRSQAFATINEGESLTQQSDAADCDINVIMKRYGGGNTGLPQVIGKPLFGDFTEATDYRTMVETIQQANNAFLEIPARLRAQFNNDPHEFIEWATNPANIEEVRKAGLAPPAPSAPSVPAAAQPTAPATPGQSTPSTSTSTGTNSQPANGVKS